MKIMNDNQTIELDKYADVVADTYCLKILASTLIRPKSAQEIAIKYNIPIAACYRKVKYLEKLGLLKCVDNEFNENGKWVKKYMSNVRNISLEFAQGKLVVKSKLSEKEESGVVDILLK